MKRKVTILLLVMGSLFLMGTISIPTMTHNTLDGLQGGQAGQYYHLTEANYTSISDWDTAYSWGNHSGFYLAIDHDACDVTSTKIGNWDTSYGWGDHSSGGYLKADGSVDLTANWTIATKNITLTAGTLTAEQITSTDDITAADRVIAAQLVASQIGANSYVWLYDQGTAGATFLRIGALNNAYNANRNLLIDLKNADRTLTLSGNAHLNQDVSTIGNPAFASVTSGGFIIGVNTLTTSEWAVLDGITSEQVIDWTSCANDFNTSGTGKFGTVAIDATIDHTLTNDTNDLVISNLNEDKDIIFSVNDGGTQKSFITIDSSKPALMLDPGTISAVSGLVDVVGTYTGLVSYMFNFHPVYSGNQGITSLNVDVDLTGTGAANAWGLWVTGNTNASQTSGTQELMGVRLEPDLKSSDQVSNAYGVYFKPTTLVLGHAGTKGIYGNYIETGMTVATAGTVNQYGVYLKGWGTVAEAGGTINSYAIYSDGGQSVHAGNLRIGDTTTPTLPLEVKADSVRIVDTQTPDSNGTGTQGEIAWDADFLYVCTATDTWERAALTGGY